MKLLLNKTLDSDNLLELTITFENRGDLISLWGRLHDSAERLQCSDDAIRNPPQPKDPSLVLWEWINKEVEKYRA